MIVSKWKCEGEPVVSFDDPMPLEYELSVFMRKGDPENHPSITKY